MLQRSLSVMPDPCCATCGGAANAALPECETPLERLMMSLQYTFIGYRYFFLKEWYRVRSYER